jgi:hypothetical protein
VLEGALAHEDSMGNGSQMRPGDVQLMSAGTGVTHSECNASRTDPLQFLQMWIYPRRRNTRPRYEQKAFPQEERRGRFRLVVSPSGEDGSLTIGQDAMLYAGLLDPGQKMQLELPPDRAAWLHVARGRLRLNGRELAPGDGAAIRDERLLSLVGLEDAEVVIWELPAVQESGG